MLGLHAEARAVAPYRHRQIPHQILIPIVTIIETTGPYISAKQHTAIDHIKLIPGHPRYPKEMMTA